MVPLLFTVRLPVIVSALLMVRVDVTVPPMVSDLHDAVAVTSGCLLPVKLASPITASTVLDGTPLVQLAAVFQAVLFVPFQLVWQKMAVL